MNKKQLLILVGIFLAVAVALGAWLMFTNQDAPVSTTNAGFD